MGDIVIDKISAFLEELEKRGMEIGGETCFICNDGAVLFAPNERGAVDITVVRNPVPINYTLGITDEDAQQWQTTEGLMNELGGSGNGGD